MRLTAHIPAADITHFLTAAFWLSHILSPCSPLLALLCFFLCLTWTLLCAIELCSIFLSFSFSTRLQRVLLLPSSPHLYRHRSDSCCSRELETGPPIKQPQVHTQPSPWNQFYPQRSFVLFSSFHIYLIATATTCWSGSGSGS